MLFKPHLPFDPEETVLSWATRLAALHTGGGLVPFLHDLSIDTQNFLVEAEAEIDRICDLAGQDPAALEPNRIRRLDRRQYEMRGGQFSVEFTKGRQTAFCPACLAADGDGRKDPHTHRRGRLIWKFRAVRTCPEHGLPLIERKQPVGTALARLAGIWGDRGDVVIDVVNDVHKICADQAAILCSEFSGSGFQFQGSSS